MQRLMQRLLVFWLTCLLICLAAGPAHAQQPIPRRGFVEAQRDLRLEQLEAEVAALKGSYAAQQPSLGSPPATAASGFGERLPLLAPASLANGGFVQPAQSAAAPPAEKKYPTWQIGAFFQADVAWFGQDAVNIATVGDVQDGADFRRARVGVQGDVWSNVNYFMEYDFGFPGRPSFMDVRADVRNLPVVGNLRFGQWRQPILMDAMTSVKELTFLERALPLAFVPFRQIGVGIFDTALDESLTWAISTFRFPTDFFGGNVGDDGGYALATRLTFVPLSSVGDQQLLHLGGAYSFGNPANNRVRYRSAPEIFVGETGGADLVPDFVPAGVPPFVDTRAIDTVNFNLIGGELAFVLNSLHMQSEVMYAVVNQINGPTVSFSGAYVQFGYFLTGEVRPYNRPAGVLGRAKPLRDFVPGGGWGAWELATRWSYLDLNDQNITGGRLNDVTVGLNWYLNPHTKFQFNYIHAFLDEVRFGESDADIAALRGQVDF